VRRLALVLACVVGLTLAFTFRPGAQGTGDGPGAATADGLGDQGRQGGRGGFGGGVEIKPGEECPPGMTEVRPLRCQAPDVPPPSIVDYRPRSTLVTPVHLVPKAKYPAVDVPGHAAGSLTSPERLDEFVKVLDSIGVGVFVSADSSSGDRLTRILDVVAASPHKDRIRVFTGINLRDVGPGWAERAVAQLEADVAAGAVGVGEVSKSFGLSIRKPDGSRLRIDDPDLGPFWDACARLGLPALIHTAEPQEFFEPLDMKNERWLELALFPSRRNNAPGDVTFEELMAERNSLFGRHPKTTFIAAHFGWHANNLARAAKLLDDFPNVMVEVGAILYDLGRQPKAAHDFFVKYQDRILFGKDSFQPEEYPYYWRVFETEDEYFDYYRDYHAFWKLYGLGLSDDVLRKVYYENAARLIPNMPAMGPGR